MFKNNFETLAAETKTNLTIMQMIVQAVGFISLGHCFFLYLTLPSSQIPLCTLNANFSCVILRCVFHLPQTIMMMTLGQGSGVGGCIFLCRCPLSKWKAVLASSFRLSSHTLPRWIYFDQTKQVFPLMSKMYTLGYILFKEVFVLTPV